VATIPVSASTVPSVAIWVDAATAAVPIWRD
jgi:hypothetical protein